MSFYLTLYVLIVSSFWFDTVNLGWSIVFWGSQVIISNKITFPSLKIVFILTNSVDPDEMLHYAAFHLGLHPLSK